MSRFDGIAARVAIAALVVAVAAMGVLGLGVLVIGGQTFSELMVALGVDVSKSESMFQDSVGRVVVMGLLVAVGLAVGLAVVVGQRLAKPVREASDAAQRIARGDFETRLPRQGPREMRDLAESIDRMAATLAEQRAARDRFIRDAAHELRTPLANLQGYLEALRDGVLQPDETQFDSLLEETARLVRLAHSLDALADGDAGRMLRRARIDLVAHVRTAIGLVEPGLRARDISIEVDAPSARSVDIDPDALAQVLGNLCSNVARYTPVGGRAEVVVSPIGIDGARVAISNTGPGIPAADLPHVFERFYRVDPSRSTESGGAGIGLSIVAQFVAAWGGEVGVESSDGLTRFWFTITG
ncbi:MAG: HAMP domain-containing histidine kinase [Chloroflexi bacterium]|nr:HAMP domain-containing histidine kinase [Chloroflexota bacterium]